MEKEVENFKKLFGQSIKPIRVKKPKPEKIIFDCDKVGISKWCCNTDVKLVQRKSGKNIYNGDVVAMCKECRISNNGAFKILKTNQK